jgi:hypothetical protein
MAADHFDNSLQSRAQIRTERQTEFAMNTFHAVVGMDQQEAHVLRFDRAHVHAQHIKSRSHHKHQSKVGDATALFADVAHALSGTHEVLLTGPAWSATSSRTGAPHITKPQQTW